MAIRDVDQALREATAPIWDWLSARSPRHLMAMVGGCFVGLVALAIASGSPGPVALGIAAWFLCACLISRL